jgi:hypothetical protein
VRAPDGDVSPLVTHRAWLAIITGAGREPIRVTFKRDADGAVYDATTFRPADLLPRGPATQYP